MGRKPNPGDEAPHGQEDKERVGDTPVTTDESNTEAPRETDADADAAYTATLPLREDARALTVVGLGGSAGSIPALREFFENVSPTSGSAYVVVLHLSQEFDSHLAEVLTRSSSLPVQQVTRSVRIEPDHVYVIPPGKDLEMRDGTLELRELKRTPGQRIVIDTFFRTLAVAHGPQSAAVVFSGTGADGTLGIRQIKESGGLVVVQSPSEAEFDAMPRSAIATGMVDYVLPATAMPAQIAAYWETSRVMRIPKEAAPSPEQQDDGADQEVALHDILTHVRVQTGHDFAFYKRATVLRRIGRRMQVNRQESLPAYRDFLRSHPSEVDALIGDLLISVTQFFRDPEAWATLERDIVPRMFTDRTGAPEKPGFSETKPGLTDAEVRAWVCGCATGEEAYTLAILLLEQAERMPHPPRVQVFATDMDGPAINRARMGIYPETIAGDLSEERLRRWFHRLDGSYQVRKEVREVVLFAHHDVLRDTPFSRLDLITCRNLLIYLNRDAQERVFRTFHFALRPDCFILLGPSESAEGVDGLFLATDKNQRLFIRRATPRSALPSLPVPFVLPEAARAREVTGGTIPRDESPRPRRVQSGSAPGEAAIPTPPRLFSARSGADSGSNVSRELLARYGPPVVVINEEYSIVHLSGSISDYLHFPEGEPTFNLLELVPPHLRPELRGALFGAAQEGEEQTRVVRSPAREGSEPVPAIRLSVRPVPASAATQALTYFVVYFERLSEGVLDALRPVLAEAPPLETSSVAPGDPLAPDAAPARAATASGEVALRLEQENAVLQRNLHLATEQYDAATEELKAANEELQATNEEMRSVVEELETGKEELQSLNEELSTVNYELKARVEELTATNSDLSNFLGATDIATVFLDRVLNVRRFTSAALALFNLIPTDVGRPLAHVTNRLDYPALDADATAVLSRLIPIEREVTSMDGQRHFLARLLPYRSLDDRIEGVVVTFVDISARKRDEEIIRQSEERLQSSINIETVGVIFFNNDFEITDCNDAFVRMCGYTRGELRAGRFSWEVFTPDRFVEVSSRALEEVNTVGTATPYEKEYIRKDGTRFWALFAAKRISENEIVEFVTDITEQKRAEAAVRASEEKFRTLSNAAPALIWLNGADGKNRFINQQFLDYTGMTAEEIHGAGWHTLVHPDEREVYVADYLAVVGERRAWNAQNRIRRYDGEWRWFENYAQPLFGADGAYLGHVGVTLDITEQKQAAEALRESEEKYRSLFNEMDEAYAVVEVLADEQGTWNDFLFLDANPAFIKHTAMPYPVGKTATQLLGTPNPRWAQVYGVVAETGAPVRIEEPEPTLGRIFDLNIFRLGGPGSRRVAVLFTNITERKESEAAVRESQQRFQSIANLVPDLLWESEPDGSTDWYNQRWLEYTGQNFEQAIGWGWTDAIHPADREGSVRRYGAAVETGKPLRQEHRIRRHDGEYRWFVVNASPLKDEDGRVVRMYSAATDIHDQRVLLETVRQSEEQFRRAIEEAPIPIIMHAEDGEVLQVSRSWTELTGYTLKDADILQTWLTRAYGFGGEEVRDAMEHAFAPQPGNPMRAVVFDITTRQGEQRTWSFSASTPGVLQDGRRFVVGMAEDITERKQAEDALRESEARFRLLVEGAKDYAMFLLDTHRRITFWSTGAERVFGWREAEAVGQPGAMTFTPEDRAAGVPEQETATTLREGHALDRRWHRRKDGTLFWADGIMMRLDDEAGALRGFAKVCRDATTQKRAEEATEAALSAVAQANDELELRVEERTAELAEMSAMRQELLRKLVSAQEEERGRIARDLHDDTGQQIAALLLGLNNLKAFPAVATEPTAQTLIPHLEELAVEVARKSHRLSFTLRPTELDDIGLLGALGNYTEAWSRWSGVPAEVEAIGFENEGTGRLPAEIETTIYRVVQEALTNILKYAASPNLPEESRASLVTVLIQRRAARVQAVVEDDGPGFDVEEALSRPPGQRRLGIFGMQERARLAGGTLEVESEPGKRTTVYLRLPLHQAEPGGTA